MRIVGGYTTSTEIWPWIAYLLIYKSGGAEQCAGSFINDEWIVTAHHCIRYHTSIQVTGFSFFKAGIQV